MNGTAKRYSCFLSGRPVFLFRLLALVVAVSLLGATSVAAVSETDPGAAATQQSTETAAATQQSTETAAATQQSTETAAATQQSTEAVAATQQSTETVAATQQSTESIISAQAAEEYSPVTSSGSENYMALVAYYCTHTDEKDAEGNSLGIGGYTRRQLTPGNPGSGYEQISGENIEAVNGNLYRFKIRDAYTNGTDYLVPIRYFEAFYKDKGYSFNKDKTGTSPFICGNGTSFSTSSGGNNWYNANGLLATDYIQFNNQWYVKIKAVPVDSSSSYYIGVVYYAVMDKVSDIANLSSTVINMFDYWATDQRKDSDNHKSSDAELNNGINENHALKFGRNMAGYGLMNWSYGGTSTPSKVTQGIVERRLGSDNYPRLAGQKSVSASDVPEQCTERTFMPKNLGDEQYTESLAYLFNPELSAAGKQSFADVKGLLSRNSNGYYYFNSQERSADLDEETNLFTEYKSPAGVYYNDISKTTISGQFFPFNDSHRTALLDAEKDPMNHYFGMSMSARFIQNYGGKKSEKENADDVIFSFSGDNDVWIFIDGVLVADLGGLRSSASVDINFHTGEIKIDDGTNIPATTIKDQFIAADESYGTSISWNGNTLPDDSVHSLKFYYLERGNYDSNLKLEYNLNQVPISGLFKVDQYGNPRDGAEFAFYPADDNYNYYSNYPEDKTTTYSSSDVKNFTIDAEGKIKNSDGEIVIKPAYTGKTEDGEMLFLDEFNMPYSIGELEKKFGSKFIMREIVVPKGYRTVSDEVRLRIEGGLIFSSNTFESGVWASPEVLVTATNKLCVCAEYNDVASNMANSLNTESNTILEHNGTYWVADYYNASNAAATSNGTLFSVVLKRNTRNFSHGFGYDFWFPVYGCDNSGYTVVTDYTYVDADGNVQKGVPDEPQTEEEWNNLTFYNAPTNIHSVLYAAKQQAKLLGEDAFVFRESNSGMQLHNTNIPGKAQRYFTWLSSNGLLDLNDPADPQYVVAYYWTSANTVADATADNTVRVYSHSIVEGVEPLTLQWSTTIEVPNMENRLYFQKLSASSENMTTDPTFVEDAVFALYNVGEDESGQIYYIADDKTTHVYLARDGNCDNKGAATVNGVEGVYSVARQWQKDTVKDNGSIIGEAGVITVTVGENTYTISPVENADNATMTGYTHNSCRMLDFKGTVWDQKVTSTGHFETLLPGKYVLREICAPEGYSINNEEIMVLINDDGVFANAGTGDNGVIVGNGPGYISSTLDLFASPGMVDETLTWIYTQLRVNNSTTFAAFEAAEKSSDGWQLAVADKETPPGVASGSVTTANKSEAMVTYLKYLQGNTVKPENGTRAIFNYAPTDDDPDNPNSFGTGQSAREVTKEDGTTEILTQEGEGTLRLYTDQGWSKLDIYQDYVYGKHQNLQKQSTNYDDHSGENLTALFSNSTFVRVADSAPADVTLKKVDSADNTKTLEGASFVLYNTEGGTNYYYKNTPSGGTQWTQLGENDKAEDFALTTDSSGLAEFKDLSYGEYYLLEVTPPTGYQRNAETYTLTVSRSAGVTVSGGLNVTQPDPDVPAYTVEFLNTLINMLPASGGAGINLYVIVGLLLMAAAAGAYGFKRVRKRERRLR